ncbi:MAG: bZIP transcription factor, partial [Planctomycetota bacterium]
LAEPEGVVVRADEAHFRGVRIRFLELSQKNGDPIPVAPAWAFADDFLVLALVPQTIKHALLEKRSLRGSDEFHTLLRRIPQSSFSHTYVDMKGVTAWIYNTAVPVLQVLQGAINGHLARFSELTRHLGGAMFYSAVEDDCLRFGYVSDFGATLLVAPFMMLGTLGTLAAKGKHEAVVHEVRRAERTEKRRAQVERLQAENALLRKRLDAIEREIAEIKRLVEEKR